MSRRGRRVAAVGEHSDAFRQFDGGAGDDDVVAVSRPRLVGMHDPAVGGGERLDVDRPTVALAGPGERLIVYWDQCPWSRSMSLGS
jgi:hypothetical protein